MSMIPGFVIDQQSQETLQAWRELGRARQQELLRGLRAGDTSGDARNDALAQNYARTLLKYRTRFIAYEEVLLLGLSGSAIFLVWLLGLFWSNCRRNCRGRRIGPTRDWHLHMDSTV